MDKFKEYPCEPGGNLVHPIKNDNKRASNQSKDVQDAPINHMNLETLSVIDERLWEQARWGGLSFALDLSFSSPPTMAFMFWDGEKAKDIFRRWHEHYGNDLSKHLKIVVLKGVNKLMPDWYSLVVIPNISLDKLSETKRYNVVARCTTMTPVNSKNLDGFLHSFNRTGSFQIVAAKGGEGIGRPEFYPDIQFVFREITVKYAWEVGLNDIERIGISWDYEPFIPPNIKNAPVLEIFAQRKDKSR